MRLFERIHTGHDSQMIRRFIITIHDEIYIPDESEPLYYEFRNLSTEAVSEESQKE